MSIERPPLGRNAPGTVTEGAGTPAAGSPNGLPPDADAAELASLRDFFENGAMCLHWVGADGTILRANKAELAFLGYDASEYVGRNITEFHADEEVIGDILTRLTCGETLVSYEARLRCKDGSIRDVLIDSSALFDEHGNFVHTRCFTRDNTARKDAERAAARLDSEMTHRLGELQTLFNVAPMGIAVASDPECRRIDVNPAMARMLGVDPRKNASLSSPLDERPGYRMFQDGREVAAEDLPLHVAAHTKVNAPGAEYEVVRADGSRTTIFGYASPLLAPDGAVRGSIGSFVDVSDRKRAEQAQHAAEGRAAAAIDIARLGTWEIDGEGRISRSRRMCEILGIAHDIDQEVAAMVVHPDDRARFIGLRDAARRDPAIAEFEMDMRIQRPDGEMAWLSSIHAIVRDEDGRIVREYGVAEDITERKQAAEEAEAREESWRALVEAIPAQVSISDAKGDIQYWNDQLIDYTGLTIAQAQAQGLRALVHPDDVGAMGAALTEKMSAGEAVDVEFRLRDRHGAWRWQLARNVPQRDTRGRITNWIGVTLDVHDRKEAEEALRQQTELLEQTHDAVLIWELRGGGIRYWNASAESMYGYTREEAIGSVSHDLLRTKHEQGPAAFEEMLSREGHWTGALRHTTKDGRVIVVESVHVVTKDAAGSVLVLETTRDVTEKIAVEEALRRRATLAQFGADAGITLVQASSIDEMLDSCARLIVDDLGVLLARVWVLDEVTQTLELRANAGPYGFDEGPPRRIAVGHLLVGKIAAERSGRTSNDLAHDPDFFDEAWAEREGLRAFAGEPLMLGDRVVGVVAMFSRQRIDDDTVTALRSVSTALALGVRRKSAEDALRRQATLAQFAADAGRALVQATTIDEILDSCANLMVEQLDAALARIWVLNEATETLELRASAGMYTHLDGAHARVRIGELKIGKIAAERAGHATNDVANDPHVADHAWAEREGLRAFAGEPPMLGDRVVGVLAMFSREKIDSDAVEALKSVSTAIALGIQRKRAEDEVRQSEERYRSLTEAVPALIATTDAAGNVNYHNQRWLDYVARTREDMLGVNWAEIVHPDDLELLTSHWVDAIKTGMPMENEYRARRHDGEYRWQQSMTVPVRDVRGDISMWIDVSIDIHDRKMASDLLSALNEDLGKANAAKDEFLGLVSHELKTPITTIYGNAEVLRTRFDRIDAESRMGALDDISKDAERLHRIIDNLLILARLDQGQVIEFEPLLVRRIVEKVVDDHRTHYPHRKIELVVKAEITPVAGHAVYLEQVVRNLISNAEKYSPPSQPIDVVLERGDGELCISVLDRGRGFSAEEGEKLFTPFYRSPDTALQAAGIGIGLAVCKRLVEVQGGRMWAVPRDGGGADIGFALPAEAPDPGDDD